MDHDQDTPPILLAQDIDTIQRLVCEVYNQGNLDAVDVYVAPTIRINDEVFQRQDFKASISLLHTVLPGFSVEATVEAILGDLILMHWKIQRATPGASESQASSRRPQLFRLQESQVSDIWIGWAALEYLEASRLPIPVSSAFSRS